MSDDRGVLLQAVAAMNKEMTLTALTITATLDRIAREYQRFLRGKINGATCLDRIGYELERAARLMEKK